jgi:putative membrane protein
MGTRIAVATSEPYAHVLTGASEEKGEAMRHDFPLALGAVIVAATFGLAAQAPSSAPAPKTQPPTTQPKTTTAAESKTNPDSHFVMEAAEGSMAEAELGQLAADKASNAKVKEFGQRMVTDHGKAGDELKTLAASKNITLPTAINAKHKATKDRLSKLSGAAFDRAYMADMVKDHQMDAVAFHKEATSGHDAEIKAWAGKTASVVDEHLKMARDIQKEIAAKPTN